MPTNLKKYNLPLHRNFDKLNPAHKSDYISAIMLYYYGGIYIDCDTICLQSLKELYDKLKQYDFVGYNWKGPIQYFYNACSIRSIKDVKRLVSN